MGKAFRIGALTAVLISVSPSVNEPFGMATVAAPEGQLSAIWRWLDPAIRTDEERKLLFGQTAAVVK